MIAVKYLIKDYIYAENRDHTQRDLHARVWAITKNGLCLNRQDEWEYEPLPSSRDETFLERCRFSFMEIMKKFPDNDHG